MTNVKQAALSIYDQHKELIDSDALGSDYFARIARTIKFLAGKEVAA